VTITSGWNTQPGVLTHTPAPFELKVPYVACVFTSRFQVFPFLEMIRRCDQRAVQQVIVTVRLITVSAACLAPFQFTNIDGI